MKLPTFPLKTWSEPVLRSENSNLLLGLMPQWPWPERRSGFSSLSYPHASELGWGWPWPSISWWRPPWVTMLSWVISAMLQGGMVVRTMTSLVRRVIITLPSSEPVYSHSQLQYCFQPHKHPKMLRELQSASPLRGEGLCGTTRPSLPASAYPAPLGQSCSLWTMLALRKKRKGISVCFLWLSWVMWWKGLMSPRESGIQSGLEFLVVADHTAWHLYFQVHTLHSTSSDKKNSRDTCTGTEPKGTAFLTFF